MANILIIYGTDEGQTKKIGEHIARLANSQGHQVMMMHGRALPADISLTAYDGVIIGASIHVGQHQAYIRDFAKDNAYLLEQMPSAFYSVSLTASQNLPEAQAQVKAYLTEFTKQTGWHPMQVGVFGGALRYNQYGFIKKMIVKTISKNAGRPTDTSRDYEYTDWVAVDRFTVDFLAAVQPEHFSRSLTA